MVESRDKLSNFGKRETIVSMLLHRYLTLLRNKSWQANLLYYERAFWIRHKPFDFLAQVREMDGQGITRKAMLASRSIRFYSLVRNPDVYEPMSPMQSRETSNHVFQRDLSPWKNLEIGAA